MFDLNINIRVVNELWNTNFLKTLLNLLILDFIVRISVNVLEVLCIICEFVEN